MEQPKLILDTHVWLWLMEGHERVGGIVDAIESAATVGALCVTDLTLWEVAALEAAGRVRLVVPVLTWIEEALSTPGLTVLEVDAAIAAESVALPGAFPGDVIDRVLVASARVYRGRVVTADPAIIAYSKQGYVDAIVV